MTDQPPPEVIDLNAFSRVVTERQLGVDGVHVFSQRRGSAEHHWMADLRRDAFSVSKTFTSVAVGLAQTEGYAVLK